MIRILAHALFVLFKIINSFISKLQILLQGGIIGAGVKINGRIFVRNRGGILKIGKGVIINSSRVDNSAGLSDKFCLTVQEGATFEIGDNSGISNSTIYCSSEIRIGSYVLIGVDCRIYDLDFHPLALVDRRNPAQPNVKSAAIFIEDDVFIGAGCFILKGVRIGKGAVVGAGSVVIKNIPEYELWAGNPAIFIRNLQH